MSAVSGTNSGSSASNQRNRFSELSSEQFVKIMMSELTNQDPLKPNDASHILEQMSSLRQIESSMTLSNKLESLVSQNQFASAGNLLGASISGVSELGQRVEGTVVSVLSSSDGPVLILPDNSRVRFNNVDEVFIPAPANNGNNGNNNGNNGNNGNTGNTGNNGNPVVPVIVGPTRVPTDIVTVNGSSNNLGSRNESPATGPKNNNPPIHVTPLGNRSDL